MRIARGIGITIGLAFCSWAAYVGCVIAIKVAKEVTEWAMR